MTQHNSKKNLHLRGKKFYRIGYRSHQIKSKKNVFNEFVPRCEEFQLNVSITCLLIKVHCSQFIRPTYLKYHQQHLSSIADVKTADFNLNIFGRLNSSLNSLLASDLNLIKRDIVIQLCWFNLTKICLNLQFASVITNTRL